MSHTHNSESPHITAPLQEWLRQGTDLYESALSEYHSLEHELEVIEARLTAKRAEVNQVAQLLGKPAIATDRRLSALGPDEEVSPEGEREIPSPIRVMAGRFARTGR